MSQQETPKGKRSWAPLFWLLLYLFNLGLVILFQCLFVHTVPAPLNANTLEGLPYFHGCKILDFTSTPGNNADRIGKAEPDFVLYQTASGETNIVRLEWNLYTPCFRIEKGTEQSIPTGTEDYKVTMKDFLGKNEVVVADQNKIIACGSSGLFRQQQAIQGLHIFIAILLLLAEFGIAAAWKRLFRKPGKPVG